MGEMAKYEKLSVEILGTEIDGISILNGHIGQPCLLLNNDNKYFDEKLDFTLTCEIIW